MPVHSLTCRSLVDVGGPDAGNFLQGLITQDVHSLRVDAWHWAALLGPQGKIQFDFLICRRGDGFRIDCEAARRDDLIRRLTMFRLRMKVTLAACNDPVVAGWDSPPATGALIDLRTPDIGWRACGMDAASADGAYRNHLWSQGVAEGAAVLHIDRLLWLEANADLLNGVSFSKGCYIGQENTARMHHRNKVRRRVVAFACSGTGTALMTGDRAAGDVLWQEGQKGFVLLRLDHADALLTLAGTTVTLHRPAWLAPHLAPDAPGT